MTVNTDAQVALTEQQRLNYLSLLGIESFVARKILPCAAPSVALVTASPAVNTVADSTDTTTVVPSMSAIEPVEDIVESPSISSVSSLLEHSPLIESIPAHDATSLTVSAVASPPQTSPPLRFALSCWRLHQDILVLDTRESGTALPTDRLLLNIARSLGYSLVQLPSSEVLRWPLFSGDQQAHNVAEAGAMVQAYISAQLAKAPAPVVILMGEAAARFGLDNPQQPYASFGETITVSSWGATVVTTPSLVDMLRDPLQKKIAWAVLKSFVISPSSR